MQLIVHQIKSHSELKFDSLTCYCSFILLFLFIEIAANNLLYVLAAFYMCVSVTWKNTVLAWHFVRFISRSCYILISSICCFWMFLFTLFSVCVNHSICFFKVYVYIVWSHLYMQQHHSPVSHNILCSPHIWQRSDHFFLYYASMFFFPASRLI